MAAAKGLAGDKHLGGPPAKHLQQQGLVGGGGATQTGPPPTSDSLDALAAVLTHGEEDRPALQAVITALRSAGLSEPLDVAFVGDGDVLPPDTAALILDGCEVHGAFEALERVFRTSREAMEGTVALRARRLNQQRGGASQAAQRCSASAPLPGSKAEARVLSALAGPTPFAKRAKSGSGTETSLRSREAAQLESAVERCFSLLRELGPRCPRFAPIFDVPEAEKKITSNLQHKVFLGNFSTARGLDSARRRFEAYLVAMNGLKLDPLTPSEWQLAALIEDQHHRGASGPRRMLQSLGWAEKAYGFSLGLGSPLIQAQRVSWTTERGAAPPKPAQMATVAMLRQMEDFVFTAPSGLLRCYAGVMSLMGHGVLRWSDVQHSKNVKLTKDAVFGVTWRMKGKKSEVPWAALRLGFTKQDWASAWLNELKKADLPGEDFRIRAPNGGLVRAPRPHRGFPRRPSSDASPTCSGRHECLVGHGLLLPLMETPLPNRG